MGKIFKKLISIVAIAAVVLAGGMFITASPVKAQTQAYQMVLGGSDGDGVRTGTYTDMDGVEHSIEFERWSINYDLPTDSGNYYLDDDVVLDNNWELADGCTNLCLNGKTVTVGDTSVLNNKYCIFLNNESSVLNIYDTGQGFIKDSDTRTLKYVLRIKNGTVNMYGGTISESLRAVKVDENSTFNLYGGSISQNDIGDMGGTSGVESSGTFNMYGGTISNNKADPGAVYNDEGIFRMYGGTISNNSLDGMFAGVYSTGDFYMYGGKIVGNGSPDYKCDVEIRSSNFVRSGGEIGVLEYATISWAKWSNKIEFNPNGGSGTMYDAYVWQDVSGKSGSITLPPNAYEKEGQRFLSWNTKADGSGVSFADGAEFTGADAGGNMTLYAQWEDFPALGGTNENADNNANNLGTSTTPQTGDNSGLWAYVSLAAAAGAGVAMTVKKKVNTEK